MTKRPKAKTDAQGRFLPNGRKAKAGLNRAILGSAWGQVVVFTRYKALRRGKLVITVPGLRLARSTATPGTDMGSGRRSRGANRLGDSTGFRPSVGGGPIGSLPRGRREDPMEPCSSRPGHMLTPLKDTTSSHGVGCQRATQVTQRTTSPRTEAI
jgi:hypothetical protein